MVIHSLNLENPTAMEYYSVAIVRNWASKADFATLGKLYWDRLERPSGDLIIQKTLVFLARSTNRKSQDELLY